MAGVRTIGIIGGGQLGRMLTLAAAPLGFKVVVVDPTSPSPAAQVGAQEITGNLYDQLALEKLAEVADVITIEIEHLDTEVLSHIAALGKPVHPAPATIHLIQNKYEQKVFLQKIGIPVAPFHPVTTETEAIKTFEEFGKKMLIKTRYGAYDGRGNRAVQSKADIKKAFNDFKGQELYAEKFVPFVKELAVMVAKSTTGELRAYPVVETVHERNICFEVKAPAEVPQAIQKKATALALSVVEKLEGAGMYGVEMFLTKDGKVLVNEIAPRVHNSGHYTMDACRTSQFEQHIRAVSGLPLGSTDLMAPAAVMINILGERNGPTLLRGASEALAIPHTSIHLYGKSPTKIDRKMGHITATGTTMNEAAKRARTARKKIDI